MRPLRTALTSIAPRACPSGLPHSPTSAATTSIIMSSWTPISAKMRLFDEVVVRAGQRSFGPAIPSPLRSSTAPSSRLGLDDSGSRGENDPAGRADADRAGSDAVRRTWRQAYRLALPLIGAYQASNVLVAAGLVLATGGELERDLVRDAARYPGARAAGTSRNQPGGAPSTSTTPTRRRARSRDRRASAARRKPAHHGVRRGRRPGPGQEAGNGRGRGAALRRRHRHRRQSAQRGSCAIRGAMMAGAPDATEIGGRREAIAEAIRIARAGDIVLVAGRAMRPARSLATGASVRRCARRAGMRRVTRCGPPTRSPRRRAAPQRAIRSRRRHLRQPRSRPGDLFVAMPGTVHDGHKFVDAPSPPARREPSSRSPSTARTCWSRTRSRRSRRSAGVPRTQPSDVSG